MNDLTILNNLKPASVFSGSLGAVLDAIAAEARSVACDIWTKDGQKTVRSLAYKIAQSKTAIDDAGKELGDELRQRLDAINADRKKARDFLEALKVEIRAPLTALEEAEKKRIAAHEKRIGEITEFGTMIIQNWRVANMDDAKAQLESIRAMRGINWEEFLERALTAIGIAEDRISSTIEMREAYDQQQAEAERLRVERVELERREAARVQAEREERMKREAADRARAEAEAKAVRTIADAEIRASLEIAERKAAEERAIKAAAEADERARKAEEDRLIAAQNAEKDKQEAIEAERARVLAAQEAPVEERDARRLDDQYRKKINREAMAAFIEAGLSEDAAKKAVIAIARGQIKNVKILY